MAKATIKGILWITLWILWIKVEKEANRMARECNQCGGTGIEASGNYCKCTEGRLLRAQEASKEKAAEKLAAEKKKRKETITEAPKTAVSNLQEAYKPESSLKVKVGDWIIHSNMLGIVEAIDGKMIRFIGYCDGNKRRVNAQGWINGKFILPEPVEDFTDMSIERVMDHLETEWIKKHIDIALAKKDKKTFKKLVKLLPQSMPW